MKTEIIAGEIFFTEKLHTGREAIEAIYAKTEPLEGAIADLRTLELRAVRNLETAVLDDQGVADCRRDLAQIRHELAEQERRFSALLAEAAAIRQAELQHGAEQIKAAEREAIAALIRPFETVILETRQ